MACVSLSHTWKSLFGSQRTVQAINIDFVNGGAGPKTRII